MYEIRAGAVLFRGHGAEVMLQLVGEAGSGNFSLIPGNLKLERLTT